MLGLYDSGLGGLSVMREVMRQLPGEELLYLGDTARLPYGGRSVEELIRFNREILAYLASEGADSILVACNTSCATALEPLRSESPVPVLGLIDAGARAAARLGRRVGVLATQATVRSDAYLRALKAADPAAEVVQLACPNLVPAVEKGLWEGRAAEALVREELAPLAGQNLDAVILGCTHFPLLQGPIQDVLGHDVALVDPAVEAVGELVVSRAGKAGRSTPRFVVTGDPAFFADKAELILGCPVDRVETVFLETLQHAGDRLLQMLRMAVPAA